MKPEVLVFDVYGTLFDVGAVKTVSDEIHPGHGDKISASWRTKQVEYFMLRQLMGSYRPFSAITRSALRYTLKDLGLDTSEQDERRLMDAYLELDLYPEVKEVLEKLHGKRLAIFSNGSPDMLEPLIVNAGIEKAFEATLSADSVKQFKPHPASYQYAMETLVTKREEVLFLSSNGWDISGAKSFGFQTAWVNRKKAPVEELGLEPDFIVDDLKGLLDLI